MAAACSSGPASEVETTGQTEEAVQSASTVLVNQLGYAPGATKVGVVVNTSSTPGTIQVVNGSGSVLWTGGSTVVKNADVNSGDKVHHADFSGFSTVGTGYKLRVTIGGTAYDSEPFDIGTSIYNPTSGLSLSKGAMKYFYWKRDGAYTVAADTTYNVNGHGQSHIGDNARGAHADGTSGGTAPWSTVTFDVQGGHLDAGDFSKYVESDTAKAFYLANMFERTKDVADPNGVTINSLDLGFNDGGLPDVLAEIAWGVRAVRGMLPSPTVHKTGTDLAADCPQNPNGVTPGNTVVPCKWLAGNKLAGDAWAQWVNIDADTATDRYVCGPSTSATYSVARNLAHISRILRPYGTASTVIGLDGQSNLTATAYADKLWETAKEAFGRASGKHPDYADYTGKGASTVRDSDLKPKQGKGFNDGSGFYGDGDSFDDKHSAEVELYLTACGRGDTTAATKYKALVMANALYKQAGPCDWGSEVPLGDPIGEERGCALLSLLTSAETLCTGGNALPAADIASMKANLYAYADAIVANINGQNYPFYVADGGQVPWGSNAGQLSQVVMLTVAYEKSGNKTYLRAANRLMDYILGVNPMKMSYVIGFGEAAETVTHDRAMKATGKYVKGTVVGGPHNLDANFAALASYWGGGPGIDDGDTPDSGPVLKHMAVVSDPANSWESQENAVNWNAALANATWGLAIHNDELSCSTNVECDDGNLCTTDTCSSGSCSNTMTTACNDGRSCTVDSCNPSTGACVNDAAACCVTDGNCSDGTACSEDVCGANELCSNPWRSTCTTTSTTTALTRSAAASSSDESADYAAAKAIDADTTTTRWASSFADNQWLRIDMGAKRYVNRVKLVWEAAHSASYDIEVADNASGPWTKIYGTTAGDGGTDDLTSANGLTPSSGRYVRMYGKTRSTGYGHSLYDFAVYGHAGTTTASCGDNSCDGTESSTCSADCGTGSTSCGDGTCNGTENCSTCASDCGSCVSCGDAVCSGSETCSDCPSDCGTCAPSCGDGACNGGETCSSCVNDCGACPPVCGDDACNGGETCSSCAGDCGACPSNTAVYLEAEAGSLSGGFTAASDANAFGSSYIMPPTGSSASAPGSARAVYSATVAAGSYTLWARVIGGTADDDSMWVKVTNAGGAAQGTPQTGAVSSFIKSNDHGATAWTWKKIHNSDGGGASTGVMSYALAAGTYTIELANREDGFKIDRLYLTANGDTPSNTLCSCPDDGNPCTVDACDANQVCQHTAGNAGGICRAAVAGGCDVAETCTGSSTVCPADGFMAAGTVCRAENTSAGCDVAETCTGSSSACPVDGFKAGGTQCRAATGSCDVAEACSGSSVSCPANGYVANGTTCNDASACTTTDVCTNGACGGTAVNCDDGNGCTTDSCNPATGCTTVNNTVDCADDGNGCTDDICSGGTCTHPALSSGSSCSDGNSSTCNDVCNGAGVCGGSTCGGSLDPVVRYSFSEASGTTAADSSGNDLSATLSGATFGGGYSGNGVRIAGGTQRVNLPANIAQSCTDATGFTIATRVNLATNGTNWSRIYDIGTSTTNYMFLSPRAGAANMLRFAMKINNGTEQQLSYTYTFPTAAWKHVAVTLNGNTATMYVDGSQVAQNTGFTNDPSGLGATANNWLGDSQFSADPTLDGTIDDFQISCRALSATEIQALVGVCTPTMANCEYQMASGSASVEAEHYYAINNQGSTDTWTLKTSVTQASGSQCMEISDGTDGTAWTSNVATTSPKMDYKVNFTSTGQFYLHIKADANAGGVGANDSCWVGIDGVVNASYIDIADAANTYGWTTFNLGNIASTGVKTVSIYGREDGFRLDKLVISNSATTPTGNGPTESTLN